MNVDGLSRKENRTKSRDSLRQGWFVKVSYVINIICERYFDKGYTLLHWATDVEILCPKCGVVGIIKGTPHWKSWFAIFSCHTCAYSLKTNVSGWQGPILGKGSKPCSYCGTKWVMTEIYYGNHTKVKTKIAEVNCQTCRHVNTVELEFMATEPHDHAVDPYFGLELALKERTRFGQVWVYNATHLKELKAFTSAKVRERVLSKWSYFTRLPSWLKEAKNREAVLKAIEKLERKTITST